MELDEVRCTRGEYWDARSGKKHSVQGVTKARVEDMLEVCKHGLYIIDPISMCLQGTGRLTIGVMWVYINTSDEIITDDRSKLVAQEHKKLSDNDDLFATTPQLEAKKMFSNDRD